MISQPMLPETIVLPARVLAPGHSVVLIDVCNACGVKIHDHSRSSHAVLLPCSHAYHAFYYAHLAEKGKCLLKDCAGVISAEDQSLLRKNPLELIRCPKTESSCFRSSAGKDTGNDAVTPAYKTSGLSNLETPVEVLLDETVPEKPASETPEEEQSFEVNEQSMTGAEGKTQSKDEVVLLETGVRVTRSKTPRKRRVKNVRLQGSLEETLAEHLRKAKKQKAEKTADEMPEMEQKGKEEEETQGQPEEDMDIDIDNKELPSTGTSSDPKPRACKRL